MQIETQRHESYEPCTAKTATILRATGVQDAVSMMTDGRYFALQRKHVTVSTVGVVPRIPALGRDLPGVSLALSLHAPTQVRSPMAASTATREIPCLGYNAGWSGSCCSRCESCCRCEYLIPDRCLAQCKLERCTHQMSVCATTCTFRVCHASWAFGPPWL